MLLAAILKVKSIAIVRSALIQSSIVFGERSCPNLINLSENLTLIGREPLVVFGIQNNQ